MNTDIPALLPLSFVLTTLGTFFLFFLSYRHLEKRFFFWTLILIGWLGLQGALAYIGIYSSQPEAMPPRFPLVVLPGLLLITIIFGYPQSRKLLNSLSLINLHWIHIVRIPVELVLYWLFIERAIPEVMTFSGRNFDILAGLTAPIIIYLGLKRSIIGKRAVLIWNFISLALLLNIVTHAVLALPSGFQQIAFEQPNLAVLYFPYVWLPAFIVPVVLFAHLVAIRQLVLQPKAEPVQRHSNEKVASGTYLS